MSKKRETSYYYNLVLHEYFQVTTCNSVASINTIVYNNIYIKLHLYIYIYIYISH
jgi:hypothetical protein